ncbi:MAG: hypothetical protein HYV09_13600 [Deltaproteobacteria bacterium]|nr:hypothetical protein [Deltaproteobacteria bacterium]
MAAHPVPKSSWKPKKCIVAERRAFRSDDPETALGLQLAAVAEKLAIDALLVGDLDGAAVASAGDEDEVVALAQLAAGLVKQRFGVHAITTTRGFVHVDVVDARGRSYLVCAFARHGVPSPIGVARAVHGAARILRAGLVVGREAPLPLVERGWGDWDAVD